MVENSGIILSLFLKYAFHKKYVSSKALSNLLKTVLVVPLNRFHNMKDAPAPK